MLEDTENNVTSLWFLAHSLVSGGKKVTPDLVSLAWVIPLLHPKIRRQWPGRDHITVASLWNREELTFSPIMPLEPSKVLRKGIVWFLHFWKLSLATEWCLVWRRTKLEAEGPEKSFSNSQVITCIQISQQWQRIGNGYLVGQIRLSGWLYGLRWECGGRRRKEPGHTVATRLQGPRKKVWS